MRRTTHLALAAALALAPRIAGAQQPPAQSQSPMPMPAQLESDVDLIDNAAREGDLPGVGRILARGVSPNVTDRDGWTPLMHAAAAGRREVILLLLQKGASAKV